MPNIDDLMQEWPENFEELLKEVGLPTADLDCDLATYVDMICGKLRLHLHVSFLTELSFLRSAYILSLEIQIQSVIQSYKRGYLLT